MRIGTTRRWMGTTIHLTKIARAFRFGERAKWMEEAETISKCLSRRKLSHPNDRSPYTLLTSNNFIRAPIDRMRHRHSECQASLQWPRHIVRFLLNAQYVSVPVLVFPPLSLGYLAALFSSILFMAHAKIFVLNHAFRLENTFHNFIWFATKIFTFQLTVRRCFFSSHVRCSCVSCV